jgi:hypothetical protein
MTSDEFPDTASDDDDPAFDTNVSHHARGYNYLLGGKDHFAADRAYVEAVTAVYPGVAATARANRAFLGRAVRFLAGEAELSNRTAASCTWTTIPWSSPMPARS